MKYSVVAMRSLLVKDQNYLLHVLTKKSMQLANYKTEIDQSMQGSRTVSSIPLDKVIHALPPGCHSV